MSNVPHPEHPVLGPLTASERAAVLEVATEVVVPTGTTLIREGRPADGLYLLLEGRVRVERGGDDGQPSHELALVGPGSWVGEGALLGVIASADVVSVDEVRALRIPAAASDAVRRVDGLMLQLDALARRRRVTHRVLALPPLPIATGGTGELELRPLWPDDWRGLASGTDRVSATSLEQRFFTVPPMTERTFRHLTDVDWNDQFAWALLHDDVLVAIGRHALQAEDRGVAELALLVADDHQGRGFGGLLVTAVVAAAAEHGASELSALARADNIAVQRLMERYGASWHRRDDGTVEARWPIDAALEAPAPLGVLAAARDIARTVLYELTDG